MVRHAELRTLSIAHMDCDAFYASVEKRDQPELAEKPVIIGGGRRGVVSTACYVARIKGVCSAMPMFKALELCPEAVVVKPRMDVYVDVSRAIRAKMEVLTPLIQPLSLDEAFLDLSGTERLHGKPPAVLLADLVRQIERDIGVTASVGLSHNKFLAKVASDLDKPKGFSIIGRAETDAFLQTQPISIIWGVGAAMRERLARDGIRMIADVRRYEETDLMARYGSMGSHIWRLAHGLDRRAVSSREPIKSISNETTFNEDIADAELLDGYVWRLAVKVSDRAKAKSLAGYTVALKLKRANFRTLSRQVRLASPTQMSDVIYGQARQLLSRETEAGPFRLIGVGLRQLVDATGPEDPDDLLDPDARKRFAAERATDSIRQRFGGEAIKKGRSLR